MIIQRTIQKIPDMKSFELKRRKQEHQNDGLPENIVKFKNIFDVDLRNTNIEKINN